MGVALPTIEGDTRSAVPSSVWTICNNVLNKGVIYAFILQLRGVILLAARCLKERTKGNTHFCKDV